MPPQNSLLVIFFITIFTFKTTSLSLSTSTFTHNMLSCSLDLAYCSSLSSTNTLTRYTFNSATNSYDVSGTTALTCSGCSFIANYMSDDGSFHVIYTSTDKFHVYTHSGGTLTQTQDFQTDGLRMHVLNSSITMTNPPRGNFMVTNPAFTRRFQKLIFHTGNNTYTEEFGWSLSNSITSYVTNYEPTLDLVYTANANSASFFIDQVWIGINSDYI